MNRIWSDPRDGVTWNVRAARLEESRRPDAVPLHPSEGWWRVTFLRRTDSLWVDVPNEIGSRTAELSDAEIVTILEKARSASAH